MDTARTLLLLATTLSMGMGAGVFATYAHTIMPGLRHTDDRTFVGAFQSMDRAVLNPWFIGGSFVGSLVLGAVATVLSIGRPTLPWVLAATVLHLVVVILTIAINVPLNDALKAAGDPDRIADLAAVRSAFSAAKWEAWNRFRVLLTVLSFGLVAWSLVLDSRL